MKRARIAGIKTDRCFEFRDRAIAVAIGVMNGSERQMRLGFIRIELTRHVGGVGGFLGILLGDPHQEIEIIGSRLPGMGKGKLRINGNRSLE